MKIIKQIIKKAYHMIQPKERRLKKCLYKKIRESSIEKLFSQKESEERDIAVWKEIFQNMVKNSQGKQLDYVADIWKGFAEDKLTVIKKSITYHEHSAPVVVCAIHNDYIYLEKFLPYYRNIGVKHFFFIDNNSTDESSTYLKKQKDVTLVSAQHKFKGTVKAGWKLQAVLNIGLYHWYLWLDSDEFLVYPGMESMKLNTYINILEKKNRKRVGGFMLDMYPQYKLMDKQHNVKDFYKDYRFFDAYNFDYQFRDGELYGGMRGRVMDIYSLRLDKTPIIYCTDDNIPFGNHDVFPMKKNLIENYGCILKHYKFLPSDAEKYKERIKDKENGFSGIDAQIKYASAADALAYTDNSVEFTDSDVLCVFPFIRDFVREE